jgi:hypothetical protein
VEKEKQEKKTFYFEKKKTNSPHAWLGFCFGTNPREKHVAQHANQLLLRSLSPVNNWCHTVNTGDRSSGKGGVEW